MSEYRIAVVLVVGGSEGWHRLYFCWCADPHEGSLPFRGAGLVRACKQFGRHTHTSVNFTYVGLSRVITEARFRLIDREACLRRLGVAVQVIGWVGG